MEVLRSRFVRVFLDSKDLINLFRKSIPMSVADARAWFEAREATLVLSQSSVSEFVPVDETDKLRIRAELQELEKFPVAYIRLADIHRLELTAAVEAFDTGGIPQPLDPYVSHFWRTFWDPEQTNFQDILFTQEIERRVNFRLHDQVLMLWTDPVNFQNKPWLTVHVQSILDDIRADTRTAREKFEAAVPDALKACGCVPAAIPGFEGLLRSRPSVAPGWRLHYEVLQEWAANTTDNAKDGDLHDIVHLCAVPYLEYATLDRRFVDYVSRSAKRLRQIDTSINYDSRIFRSFGDLMKAIP